MSFELNCHGAFPPNSDCLAFKWPEGKRKCRREKQICQRWLRPVISVAVTMATIPVPSAACLQKDGPPEKHRPNSAILTAVSSVNTRNPSSAAASVSASAKSRNAAAGTGPVQCLRSGVPERRTTGMSSDGSCRAVHDRPPVRFPAR